MFRKIVLATTVLLGLLTAQGVQAATITVEKDGCTNPSKENEYPCWLFTVQGEIKQDDWKVFDNLIKKNDVHVGAVMLDSPGGALMSGLAIGVTIHDASFSTLVPEDGRCVSVCAAMWLAGAKRYITSTSKVGFHQAYLKDPRTGRIYLDPKANAFVRAVYVKKFGISLPAADFFTSASPERVNWMNHDLAKGFDLEVIELPTKAEREAAAKAEEDRKAKSRLLDNKPLSQDHQSVLRQSKGDKI
jgi:hypothetical protein